MDAKEERLGGGVILFFLFISWRSIHVESLEPLEPFYFSLASALMGLMG